MNDQWTDFCIAVGFHILFWIIFKLTWWSSLRYGQHSFEKFSEKDKAEWCSRACSTIHASIVIPGVVACILENSWKGDGISFTSPVGCRFIFSVSIGYFCQDMICLVWWRLNLWQAFMVHHFVAALPYAINNFVPNCHSANYVLALYLLVEVPTLPLNYVGHLDQIGMRNSMSRFMAFLAMYGLWFVSRILLPIYLLIVLYEVIIPEWYSERSGTDFAICIVPSAICANIIAFFCFYVFFTHLSVDMYNECKGPKQGRRAPTVTTVGSIPPLVAGRGTAIVDDTYGTVPPRRSNDPDSDSSDDEVFGIKQMFGRRPGGSRQQREDSPFNSNI